MNMTGAIAFAKFAGIQDDKIKIALEKIEVVRGRMEKIEVGQNFEVIVDYAHTPDSLKAVYETYKSQEKSGIKHKLICVLGNTGGGRDTWKRPEMGKVADQYCDQIILTNEDPYDEDPKKIVGEMVGGITEKNKVEIIMDRREAIQLALSKAKELTYDKQSENVAVLITGKGTDPYIMGPNGSKEEWDDVSVAREELQKLRASE
jgi:UDP-N-acetylmuramoyl-L-alanyl-D-glutamate--2,6-diaminopimelate ligase